MQHVMVGDREEAVALFLIPVRDHLRIVITVAPKRMRVQVALVPTQGLRIARKIRRLRLRGGTGVHTHGSDQAEE